MLKKFSVHIVIGQYMLFGFNSSHRNDTVIHIYIVSRVSLALLGFTEKPDLIMVKGLS